MASDYDFVIRRLEQARGTWRKISRATGIPPTTIKNIVHGHSKNPGFSTIEQLARHFRSRKTTTGNGQAH